MERSNVRVSFARIYTAGPPGEQGGRGHDVFNLARPENLAPDPEPQPAAAESLIGVADRSPTAHGGAERSVPVTTPAAAGVRLRRRGGQGSSAVWSACSRE